MEIWKYSLCPSEISNFFLNLQNKGYASSILTFDSSLKSSETEASPYIWFSWYQTIRSHFNSLLNANLRYCTRVVLCRTRERFFLAQSQEDDGVPAKPGSHPKLDACMPLVQHQHLLLPYHRTNRTSNNDG